MSFEMVSAKILFGKIFVGLKLAHGNNKYCYLNLLLYYVCTS